MNAYLIQSEKELKEIIEEVIEASLSKVLLQILPKLNLLTSTPEKQKQVLNLKETQELLGMYRDGVLGLVENGSLPYFRPPDSRNYKFLRSDVMNLFQVKSASRIDSAKKKERKAA